MFLRNTDSIFILKLTSSAVRLFVLSRKAPVWLTRRYHKSQRPKMSKVISRKVRNPDNSPLEINKKEKYINSQLNKGQVPRTDFIRLSVIKSGAFDGSKSVVIETPFQNYLFNCGEGTQRQIIECKVKLFQIEDIFLTHKSWENIGGLFGMLMTAAGQNKYRGSDNFVRIHGPPHVEQVLQMTKNFSESPKAVANIEKREIAAGSYSNYQMDVEYVKITKARVEQTDMKTEEEPAQSSDTEEPQEKKQKLNEEETDFAVAYIVRPKLGPWSVNKTKLMTLKDKKPGPWLRDVLDGKPHTLEDGRVITREEIGIPPKPVLPVVVLECPSSDYLESFLSSEQLCKLADDENDHPQLMVHMSPAHILETDEYQGFMKRYANTDHLLVNKNSKPSIVPGSIMFHQGLNNIHPGLFPELESYRTHADPVKPTHGQVVQGEAGLKYHIKPLKGQPYGFDWDSCCVINRNESVEESFTESDGQAMELVEAWKQQLKNIPEPDRKRQYPEVVFLGTGSAQPCRYRNVSGILVHLSPEKCMLLDCGEGTEEQIRCFYGNNTDDVYTKLSAVFISHLHADHHLGLFGVINARRKALQNQGLPIPRLPVLAPIQIQRWLYLYFRIIMNLFSEIELIRHVPNPEESPATESVYKAVLEKLDLHEFRAVPVNHVPNSFGVSMTHKSGWKLVYSGDTTPCQRLVEAGKGCDLLIHEASFSDDLPQEALFKNHSTVSQAIQIGREMEAKFILLNHFSQRYSKVPLFTEDFTENVAASFDLMKVSLDDLPYLAQMKPVLESVFAVLQATMNVRDKEKNTSEIEMLNKNLAKKGNVQKNSKGSSLGQKTNFKKVIGADVASPEDKQNIDADKKKNKLTKEGENKEKISKVGDNEKLGQTKDRENKNKISDMLIESLDDNTDLCTDEGIGEKHKGIMKDLADKIETKEYDIQDYAIVGKLMGQDLNIEKDRKLAALVCDNSTLTIEAEGNLEQNTDEALETAEAVSDKLEQIKVKCKK